MPVQMRKTKFMIFCMMPVCILLGFIYVYPGVNLVQYAFRKVTIMQTGEYMGLANFYTLSKDIWPVVRRTFIWTFGSVFPAMILGLGIAILFQDSFKGRKLLISICILPWAMPLVIVAFLWRVVYDPTFGFINVVLGKLHLVEQPINFLSLKRALLSVTVARIWRATPFAFIIYQAYLQSIPQPYYEAAKVDGASSFQLFFHITLPLLRSISVVIAIVLTIWTTLIFDIIYAMTGGGPIEATEIVPIKIYHYFQVTGEIGVACALSVTMICILTALSGIYWAIIQKEEA